MVFPGLHMTWTVQNGRPVWVGDPAPGTAQAGLGDLVAAAAKAVGIEPTPDCGCAEKRARLNQATPGWVRPLLGRLGLPGSPEAPPGPAGGPVPPSAPGPPA